MSGYFRKLVIVLCVSFVGGTALSTASQPSTSPSHRIEFVKSSKAEFGNDPEVQYRVVVRLRRDRSLQFFHNWVAGLLSTPMGKTLSDKQKQWLSGLATTQLEGYLSQETPRGAINFAFYAVSEDDARKMALAFLEWLDSQSRKEYEETTQKIAQNADQISTVQQRILSVRKEIEANRLQMEELMRTGQYASVQQASEATLQLGRERQNIEIDLAGTRARIQAIQKRFASSVPELRVALEKMLVEQEVNLADFLARKGMVEKFLTDARRFMELPDRIARLGREQDQLRESLFGLQREEASLKQNLDASPMGRPVSVVQDKVRIFPLVLSGTAQTQPAGK